MKICLVNVARGAWYPRGQRRLADSTKRCLPEAHLHMWQTFPSGVTHEQAPYAFKPKGLKKAVETCDPDILVWLDASAWFERPAQAFVERIVERRVACWWGGFTIGDWCSDVALPLLGITREEAFGIKLVQGMPLGLDMRTDVARQLLDSWEALADAGAFQGPWKNDRGQASSDPRVHGHRHDMPALAVLVHRLGIEPNEVGDLYALPPNQDPNVCILARGM